MHKFTKIAGAAAIVGATMLAAGAAQAGMRWQGGSEQWDRGQYSFCRLVVEEITQDNPGQRLRVKLRNVADERLAVGLTFTVKRPGRPDVQLGFQYDNINKGESRQADSSVALPGPLTGQFTTTIVAKVNYCYGRD